MARICYVAKKFTPAHAEVIEHANAICTQYAGSGLSLTLRQLYYQFVARGLLPNRQTEYKRLSEILNDARMAGELDWSFLVDRTRNLTSAPHWSRPARLIESAAEQYRTDLWRGQGVRVEVWIEKDAGIGVIESVCDRNDVPYFSCRGYTSASEAFSAGQRVGNHLRHGDRVVILHIGDHDPSGLDMSRDIEDRLRTFVHQDWISDHLGDFSGRVTRGQIKASMRARMGLADDVLPWEVRRIALNQPQIERYTPPPNPAKTTDSRFVRYQEETGLDESWELDALDPFVLQDLIQRHIDGVRDRARWDEASLAMERDRALLRAVGSNWPEIRERYHTDEMGPVDQAAADEEPGDE